MDKPTNTQQMLLDEQDFTLRNLLLLIISKWRLIVRIAVIGALIGVLCSGVSQYFNDTATSVEAAIRIYFPDISNGKAPDGSSYSITEIESTAVLQRAIDQTGVNVSVTALANALTEDGVLSDAVANFSDMVSNLQNEQLRIELEQQGTSDATPNIYVIRFKELDKLGLTEDEGRQLLDEVIQQYRTWLIEKYYGDEVLGNVFAGDFSVDDYDYIQVADLLSDQVDSMRTFIRTNISDTSFTSANNGYSRDSLLDITSSIDSNEIERIYMAISTNFVTKNASKSVAVYDNLSTKNEQSAEKYSREATLLLQLIESYFENTGNTLVVGEGISGEYSLRSQSAQYDKMIAQYISASTQSSNDLADAAYYKTQAGKFADAEMVSGPDSASAAEVTAMIEKARSRVEYWIDVINTTVSEYKANSTYQQYLEQLLPSAQYKTNSASPVIAIVLGVVLGALLGLLYVLLHGYIFWNRERKKLFETSEGGVAQ